MDGVAASHGEDKKKFGILQLEGRMERERGSELDPALRR